MDDELAQHERNTDLIFGLITRIDDLLYEVVLDKPTVQSKLLELNNLVVENQVMQYIRKVQRYIDNYDSWSPIERLHEYSIIYR